MSTAAVAPAAMPVMGQARPSRRLDALSPEFRLAVACCVWPPGPYRDARISAALKEALDWNLFLGVVKRHRVQGLAMDAISRHAGLVPQAAIPLAVVQSLELSAMRYAGQSLALAAETVKVTRLFEKSGIRVGCIKGSSLSMLAFGNLALRQSKDIDLLVDPRNALAADEILRAAGYEMTMPTAPHSEEQKQRWMGVRKHFEYKHNRSAMQVELHWRLVDNQQLFSSEDGLATCVAVPIATGMAVPTLGCRDLLLYLCMHGANHMWFRLKWIADLGALLSQNHGSDIQQLLEDAEMRDCLSAVTQALLLSQMLFNVPAAEYEIPSNRTAKRLLAAALAAMTEGNGAQELDDIAFATSRVALARYDLKHDWKFWIQEARIGLVDEVDRHNTRLPQGLSFLLPLLRIPLWMGRRLLHGGRSGR